MVKHSCVFQQEVDIPAVSLLNKKRGTCAHCKYYGQLDPSCAFLKKEQREV